MDKGAHLFKCDFQVHTPRDLNWDGHRPTTDEEREDYAEAFIADCRSKGLQTVAITDHHDVAFFNYIRTAALAETDQTGNPIPDGERVIVFPGMELTLGVPCQALLILDADFPVALLEQVAQALSITTAPPSDPKHADIKRIEHIKSFDELYETLNQRDFLRGRFFVMPHVGDSGHGTLVRKGFATHYKNMPCVGGYVDGELKMGSGASNIVNGKDKEWGNKPIGVFQTSDNRRRDFANLGKHVTWVKWARPTAEALRQACLARESRLSLEEPTLPGIFITRLEISNSQFLGPVVLDLNPQYNALIGGRGTGKSTLLEYLRWVLCDQPPMDQDSELPDFQRRRRDLIKKTLEPLSATVTVTFLKNGIEHVVRRKTGTNEILLKIGSSSLAACTEPDVRNLLPVQAYSQKQLSSVGVKIEELDRFVHAPIKNELTRLEGRITELKAQLKVSYEEVGRHRALSAEIAKLDLERRSLDEQIEKLRGSLKGLSEDDRQVISLQSSYEVAERLVAEWEADLARASSALGEMENAFAESPQPMTNENVPDKNMLVQVNTEVAAWFTDFRENIARQRATLDSAEPTFALGQYASTLSEWRAKRAANLADYGAAKERSAAHEGTLRQIREVEDRLKVIDTTAAERRHALQRLGDPSARFAALRKEWVEVHQERSRMVGHQCDQLTSLSKDLIRARLRRGHRVGPLEDQLKNVLKGSKIRGERYERLWERIKAAGDPMVEWHLILDELEALAHTTVEDETKTSLPATPILEGIDLSIRDRQAIARSLSPEAWLSLLLLDLDDVPEFDYRAREDEYIKFNDASAGQQATALMYVLLNQPGPPLVIDQPEDDLDNKVMEEIVREIWAAKNRRQLIFSSHNANLVVNGDAELVVCCDYRVAGDQSGGKVKLEGAIDIPEINAEITGVMEGGRAAFALRQAKYGF